jgi:isopentenyl-diphosphate Delta-isomerase
LSDVTEHPDHEVVSSDDELLILVDEDDNEIGHLTKAACHRGEGVLHRAFSLFIFNRSGKLLLQRRSDEKMLWPGFWSNSCCSHPRRGESIEEAVDRRLLQELGMRSDLHFLYKFSYHAGFADVGSECELCSVFVGSSDDEVRPNRHEIADWRWVSPEALDVEMEAHPERFSPWFAMEWPRVRASFHSVLGIKI